MSGEALLIQRLETAPFGTNAYVISCPETRQSVLIDAPGQPDRILGALEGTKPRLILLTHGHFDHTDALRELADRLRLRVAAHAADAAQLPFSPDTELRDGDRIDVGGHTLEVLHTPGHTPGSLCFLAGDTLFSGDTLFPGGPGRTSRPAAFRQIIDSLEHKIFTLPDDTRVLPGHGESTVLKKEKETYAVFAGRDHPPDLCGDVLWLSS